MVEGGGEKQGPEEGIAVRSFREAPPKAKAGELGCSYARAMNK